MIGKIHPLASPPASPRAAGPRPSAPAGPEGPMDLVAFGPRLAAAAEVPETPAPRAGIGRYVALGMALLSAGGALVGAAFLPDLAADVPPPAVARVVEEPAARPGPPVLDADALAWARQGKELSAGSVLKPDAYPGLHNGSLQEGKSPQPLLPGAANFRRLPDRPIYGVAQPTVEGMRNVLRQAGAGPGGKATAWWTSMREEPVVYVNGRSLNVRDLAKPFANREDPGSSTAEVEAREDVLKAEVLAEAAAHGGRIMVHEEGPDGALVARWEKVAPESVQTPAEVYRALQAEGFRVDYARIPVTDEQSPEPGDFDALTRRLAGAPDGAPLIFNCHAGRGRTTTAMVTAELLLRARSPESRPVRFSSHPSVRDDIREQGRFERGEYRVILSLIRALADGTRSKAEVDEVIDTSAAMQNLREAIAGLKDKAEGTPDAARAAEARQRGEDYLHRYFMLVTFDAYATEQAPNGFEKSFEQWLQERPDLGDLLQRMELALRAPAAGDTSYA